MIKKKKKDKKYVKTNTYLMIFFLEFINLKRF